MIFAIKPFEIHDGDGIRTTIFFKGCPLRCKWCHNPESFSFEKEICYNSRLCRNCSMCTTLCEANTMQKGKHVFEYDRCTLCGKCESICPANAFEVMGKDLNAEQIAREVLRDVLFMKNSGGGVTFSGGEPLMQAERCVDIARILKAQDINIAVDTSGYVQKDAIDKIVPYADTFLFDIKAIDEDVHIACTGVSNQLILENIEYVDSLGIPMEIRYPYVPTMNDGQAEKIAHFVKGLHHVKCLRIIPYHNYAETKYSCLQLPFSDFPVPTKEDIRSVSDRMSCCSGVKVCCFQD